ncbi:hypothetical protein H8356DRAFT_1437324 [Neocallimastix lanati (nom. inval.)]|nr:hypothetical protein H8356DRAFT_1437324 [Neocallimastix sp. JGI-2020a]
MSKERYTNITYFILISISIADCIPSKNSELCTIPTANIDSIIINNLESNHIEKRKIDNIIQILMFAGVQTLLLKCYIKNSYLSRLSSKELFIHSKSGRFGTISTSLKLIKSSEDLISDIDDIIYD